MRGETAQPCCLAGELSSHLFPPSEKTTPLPFGLPGLLDKILSPPPSLSGRVTTSHGGGGGDILAASAGPGATLTKTEGGVAGPRRSVLGRAAVPQLWGRAVQGEEISQLGARNYPHPPWLHGELSSRRLIPAKLSTERGPGSRFRCLLWEGPRPPGSLEEVLPHCQPRHGRETGLTGGFSFALSYTSHEIGTQGLHALRVTGCPKAAVKDGRGESGVLLAVRE